LHNIFPVTGTSLETYCPPTTPHTPQSGCARTTHKHNVPSHGQQLMASSNQSRQLTDDNGFVQPWSNHLGINKEPHMSQWKHTDTPNVG